MNQKIHSAEANLKSWLSIHRLPDTFPLLDVSAADHGDVYLRSDGDEVREILDRIQGSPRTIVRFVPGQGASTVLGEMIRLATDANTRGMNLFLEVGAKELEEDDDEDATAKFPRLLLRRIFEQLLDGYWENRLYAERRAFLLGLLGAEDNSQINQLRDARDSGDDAALKKFQKQHRRKPGQLISQIHSNLNITTFIIFDFPRGTAEDDVRGVTRAMKWFDQKFIANEVTPAALSEVYFMPDTMASLMQSLWARDFQLYDFPAYNQAEMFQILASRYHPKLRRENIPLASVFSDQFVARAWRNRASLEELASGIREHMLQALDIPSSDIPLSLSPKTNMDT